MEKSYYKIVESKIRLIEKHYSGKTIHMKRCTIEIDTFLSYDLRILPRFRLVGFVVNEYYVNQIYLYIMDEIKREIGKYFNLQCYIQVSLRQKYITPYEEKIFEL